MGKIHEIRENVFLDARIGMQIKHRCKNGQTMDETCYDYPTFKA